MEIVRVQKSLATKALYQAQKGGGKHGTSNLQLLCHACHTTTESYGTSQKI
ncbi:HNH endonuclease [Ktedonobacter sp. SOSP1-85]|uniref:HNH endonuclease n=1 Tax=Ktedonobacter sp. SOSP1-85 TaxID=2778367 RepID=UPI0019159925